MPEPHTERPHPPQIQYHLRQSNPKKSWQTFLEYAQGRGLSETQRQQFEKLIYGMHLIQNNHQTSGDRVSLERLSDESGIPVIGLSERIRELRQAGGDITFRLRPLIPDKVYGTGIWMQRKLDSKLGKPCLKAASISQQL